MLWKRYGPPVYPEHVNDKTCWMHTRMVDQTALKLASDSSLPSRQFRGRSIVLSDCFSNDCPFFCSSYWFEDILNSLGNTVTLSDSQLDLWNFYSICENTRKERFTHNHDWTRSRSKTNTISSQGQIIPKIHLNSFRFVKSEILLCTSAICSKSDLLISLTANKYNIPSSEQL